MSKGKGTFEEKRQEQREKARHTTGLPKYRKGALYLLKMTRLGKEMHSLQINLLTKKLLKNSIILGI